MDKMMIKRLVTMAVAGGCLAAPVLAGEGVPTPAEKYLMTKGTKIVQTFPSVSGLKAIVADNGKEKRLFYVTPDGKSLISGLVFDTAGANVTSADMARAGVSDVGGASALSDEQWLKIWKKAEGLKWVKEGKSNKVIYVIFDPNCPYCHRLWTELRSFVRSGKVEVRWLPVAILKESSKGLAAGIYSDRNPAEALQRMVNKQLLPTTLNQEINKALAYNLLLLKETGYTGVPTILFQKNNKVRGLMGEQSAADLAKILQ